MLFTLNLVFTCFLQTVVELVGDSIVKEDTNFRQCIPVRKRVAVAVVRLATNTNYRVLGHLFAIGASTAQLITDEVVKALSSQAVVSRFIKFPTGKVRL